MKNVFHMLTTGIFLASCLCNAQTQSQKVMLGTIQDIAKSSFCKKYQCQPKYDEQVGVLSYYILNIPRQDPGFFTKLGRVQLLPDYDSKKQLTYIAVNLQEDSKTNIGINYFESIMLADLVYSVVGTKLTLKKQFDFSYSPDISDCFSDVRFKPKENFALQRRQMLSGVTKLQVDNKKVKYRVVCMWTQSSRDTKMYFPTFEIEVLNAQ
jgi:hypothetical protein